MKNKQLTPLELERLQQLQKASSLMQDKLAVAALGKELDLRKLTRHINEVNANFEAEYKLAAKEEELINSKFKDLTDELNSKYGVSDYNLTTGEIVPKEVAK